MTADTVSAPEWVSKRESLFSIWNEIKVLRDPHSDDGLEYRHVLQSAANASLAALEANPRREQGDLRHPSLNLPILTVIFDNGSAVQMLRTHTWVIRKSALETTDAVLSALQRGRLILALASIRAVIEQVALLASTCRSLSAISLPETFEAANASLVQAKTVLAKSLYATRVDWSRVFSAKDLDGLLNSGKIAYQRDPEKADVAAQSIMTSVDKLEKRLPGVRNVYELLCEVAHPNIGHLLFSTTASTVHVDRNGIPWVHKTLGSVAPVALIDEVPHVPSRADRGQLSAVVPD